MPTTVLTPGDKAALEKKIADLQAQLDDLSKQLTHLSGGSATEEPT